jgi:phage terminase large subunit GpA-like protein
VKQLVAEQLVTVTTKRGFQRLEWQKIRERNEVLDCRVYARAAAWIAGVDRWTESKWRALEDQLNASAEGGDETRQEDEMSPVTAGVLGRPPPATGKRRSTWLDLDQGWLSRDKGWSK